MWLRKRVDLKIFVLFWQGVCKWFMKIITKPVR